MTREEALLFKTRWQLVNERISEEVRQMSATTRLRQLVSLYHTARSMGWLEELRQGEEEVRLRWQKLRSKWNERKTSAR